MNILRTTLAGACCTLILAGTAQGQLPVFTNGVQIGTNQNAAVPEVSGLAASRQNPHVLWVHNDSGDSARIFALNRAGALLGTYNITNAFALDWEDLALAKDPSNGVDYLYIADIGDNLSFRPNVQVYRVPEPVVGTNQFGISSNLAASSRYTFSYPGGARDAETLLVDPWTGDIYVVSKFDNPSRVYYAPYPHVTNATITMIRTNDLAIITIATGGDASAWQTLIRTPFSVHYFPRMNGQSLADSLTNVWTLLPYTNEPQGEAICWEGRERGYYTLSEFVNQPIYWYAANDADEDGLVDSAEVAYQTLLTNTDSDADGQIDGDEVIAGVDPTNTASSFDLTYVSQTGSTTYVQWFARTNRQYDVQRAPITNIDGFIMILTSITVTADQDITTNIPTADSQFIRLRVRDTSGW